MFGGAGFIGTHLVERLAKQGFEVAIGETEDALSQAEAGCDVAVFCQGGRSDDFAQLRAVHAELTERLLAIARPRRAVFISSGECYGQGPVPFREAQPLLGTSPYAQAKIAGEEVVRRYASETGNTGIVFRLAVAYGPGQRGTMLLPYVLSQLLSGRPADLTPGQQTRDFVAVADVTALIARALCDDVPGGTYNLGTGVETTVRDAALTIARVASEQSGSDLMPLLRIGARPQSSGGVQRYALDPALTTQVLGLAPELGLEAGIERMVASALATQS